MKSYLDLIPIYAKVHRRQNRMTLLCVAISVFLVTAVFGMAEMGFRMEADRLAAKHENYNISALLNTTMGQTLVIIAFVLFMLIMIAGVLMISGSINSSVAQRTQFFGMMRCIGMSSRQITRFVRLEALNWCKTAIPMGLVSGSVMTWLLCAILHYAVEEEFSEITVFGISIPGLIGGTAVGLITVLIAASKPAKKAASVSPIAAVSGNTDTVQRKPPRFIGNIFSIETKLGIAHATGIKRNLILIAGSFTLTVILFLSLLGLADFVNFLMPQYSNTADIEIISQDGELLDKQLVETLAEMSGVKRVFGRNSALDIMANINGVWEVIDIISYDDFDLRCLSKDHLLRNGSHIDRVYGDSRYVLATWDRTSFLQIGDILLIGSEALKIAGLLKYDPFSSDGMTGGKITLITSGETFTRLTGKTAFQLISIQTDHSVTDANVDTIRELVGDEGIVRDLRDMRTSGTYTAFMLFIYGFLAIIALVSLLNIVNTISMSVSVRIKQYGAMRAVGMSTGQVTQMIAAEALTYALAGIISGYAVGLTINRAIYRSLIENHFAYAAWNFPIFPLLIILLFLLLSVTLSILSPSARIRSMAITEIVNEL